MSNRRLEVFRYRQVLYQMQQGMSDRAIALGGTMGRRKAAQLRCKAATEGWLTPGASLPDDATLAALFITPKQGNTGPVSTPEVHRARIAQWVESGIAFNFQAVSWKVEHAMGNLRQCFLLLFPMREFFYSLVMQRKGT